MLTTRIRLTLLLGALTFLLGAAPAGAEAAPPTVFTGTNTPESDTEVLLRGAVNPENSSLADCHFAFGATTAYGQSAPCESATPIEGSNPLAVTAKLTGLDPGATYHFQLVATNGTGTTPSEDDVFATFSPEADESCANEARREEQHAPSPTAVPTRWSARRTRTAGT